MAKPSASGSFLRIEIDKEKVTKAFARVVENIFGTAGDTLDSVAQTVADRMSVPGSPITRPVNWDSEKQRMAFFKTKGFGSGIPYVRTQAYENGWTIDRLATRGKYKAVIRNTAPGAFFIGGNYRGYQSRIHKGRWPRLRDVIKQIVAELPKRFRERLSTSGRSR